jgi:hypothetical protein
MVVDAIYPVTVWKTQSGHGIAGNHFPETVALATNALNAWHGFSYSRFVMPYEESTLPRPER